MIVIPLDVSAIWILTGFCAIFEFLRIVLANWWHMKDDTSAELKTQKIQLQRKIHNIPVTQISARAPSERQIIKIDKQLEQLKLKINDGGANIVKISRIVRLVVYCAVGLLFRDRNLILINAGVLPLMSLISERLLISPHLIFLIFVFGFGWRHVFRTLMPLWFRRERVYV